MIINNRNIYNIIIEMENQTKLNKTSNLNKYMREYMKKKYNENPSYQRNYKNSLNMKKKYVIADEVWSKYKENLYAIVIMKQFIDNMPDGIFEMFLMDYKKLNFKKLGEGT